MREPSLVHSRSDEADRRLRSVQRRFRTIRRRYERSRRPAVVRFALVVVAVAALGFAGMAAFLLLAG